MRARPFAVFAGLLFLLSIALPGSAQLVAHPRATNVFIGPAPSWCRVSQPHRSPPAPAKDVTLGEAWLLVDEQINARTQEYYTHYATEVLNQSGIQNNGRVEADFDPTYQSLVLHHIDIIRGTNRISQLTADRIRLIQQEQEMAFDIYNGRISTVVLLEDLRVGDIVDYSYTRRGQNPVLGRNFATTFRASWSRPVAQQLVRVVWFPERELFLKSHRVDIAPVITTNRDAKEYVWEFKSAPSVPFEAEVPIWYDQHSYLQLSDFKNWEAVAKWARRLYSSQIKSSPELDAQLKAWQELPTEEARILAAVRFMQDDVRYAAIAIGPHSHKPQEPHTVFQRRFGDCKDKSLLLCALLRRMGFKADPALVNTVRRHTVADWHPSPYAFNHVIVRLKLGQNIHWIDATRSHQRGSLRDLFLPNYGRALVIDEGTDNLSEIPFQSGATSRMRVQDVYTIHSYDKPVELRSETEYEGAEADRMRSTIADTSKEELEKDYLNYYATRFPNTRIAHPLFISDDSTNNRIRVLERYIVPAFWSLSDNKRQWTAEISPHAVSDIVDRPETSVRTMPLGVAHPRNRTHTVELHFPDHWDIEQEHRTVKSRATRMDYAVSTFSRRVELKYDYQTTSDSVPLTDVGEYLRSIDEMQGLFPYYLSRPNTRGSAWLLHVNWPILGLAIVTLLSLSAVAILIYRRTAVPVEGPPPLPVISIEPNLSGIRGWLVLVAFGLIASPFIIGTSLIQAASVYFADNWEALTSSQSATYHPLWAPYLIFSLLGNLALLVFSILLVILFFQRRRVVPKIYVTFLFSALIMAVVDYVAIQALPDVEESVRRDTMKEITRSITALGIWGTYFLVSRRVKATFVR